MIPEVGGAAAATVAFPTPVAGNWLSKSFPPSYNPPNGEAKGCVTNASQDYGRWLESNEVSPQQGGWSWLFLNYSRINAKRAGDYASTLRLQPPAGHSVSGVEIYKFLYRACQDHFLVLGLILWFYSIISLSIILRIA